MPLDETLIAYLDHLGTPIRAFKQGKGWTDLPQATKDRFLTDSRGAPVEADMRPSEGYCRGAALDWLRRALVKGKPTMTTDHGNARRVERMVAAWQKPYMAQSAAVDRRNQESNRQYQEYQSDMRRAGATLVTTPTGEQQWTYSTTNSAQVEAAGTKFAAAKAKLVAESAKVDKEGALAEVWEQQASALDAAYRSKSGLGKGFSDLYIVASRGKGAETYRTWHEYLGKVLYMKTFVPDTGMLLGVNLDKVENRVWVRGTGHAIAIFYESTSSLMLFDPNLGIYSFNQLNKVANAIAALFDYGYTGNDCRPSTLSPGGDCYIFTSLYASKGIGGALAHPALREAWEQDTTRATVPTVNTTAATHTATHCLDDFQAFQRRRQAEEARRLAAAKIEANRLLRLAKEAYAKHGETRPYAVEHNKAQAAWKAAGMTLEEAKAVFPAFENVVYNL